MPGFEKFHLLSSIAYRRGIINGRAADGKEGRFMDILELLASVPIPSTDELNRQRSLARYYTLVFLRKGPASRSDVARNERLQLEHLQHLAKLQILGKLVLNGPTLVEHDILGVSVYATELEEARALAEADPKVKAGFLIVEAIPWMAVPGTSRVSAG
jgi:uncharacterized protein YciI